MRASARSSWSTSGPSTPSCRSRLMGSAPGSTNTGRPSTAMRHVAGPELGLAARRARDDVAALLDAARCASTAGCAAPKRTVPRTMTSVESVRRSTGTVMGAGCGAAVSAATWAGERICRAAAQPTIARAIERRDGEGRDAPVARATSSSPAVSRRSRRPRRWRRPRSCAAAGVAVVDPGRPRPAAGVRVAVDDRGASRSSTLTPPPVTTWPASQLAVAARDLAPGRRVAGRADPAAAIGRPGRARRPLRRGCSTRRTQRPRPTGPARARTP